MQVLKFFFMGFFVIIGLGIIFVQAGKGGTSGGTQAASVIQATGKSLGELASTLETGNAPLG